MVAYKPIYLSPKFWYVINITYEIFVEKMGNEAQNGLLLVAAISSIVAIKVRFRTIW